MSNELEDLRARVAALEAEAARLRALLEATPDLVVRVATDGTYRDVMEARGIPVVARREDRVGRPVQDLLPLPIAAAYLRAVTAAVETGVTQAFEYELRLEGKTGYYEARASRSGLDEAVVLVRDVSERKRVELALERSEALLRTRP